MSVPVPAFDSDELVARYAVADRSAWHLRVNFIASLDGAATHDGVSGALNDPADKQVFDTLRMLADVVLVAAGTIRDEGYDGLRVPPGAAGWRRDQGMADHPVIAVVSSRLDLDPAAPLFTDAPVRPLVITHGASPAGRRAALSAVADVLVCGDSVVDPAVMREQLTGRGLTQVLCEGGPHWLGSLIAADAVDELCLTLAPVLEGGDATRITRGGIQATRRMRLAHVLTAGDMLMLRYLREGRA